MFSSFFPINILMILNNSKMYESSVTYSRSKTIIIHTILSYLVQFDDVWMSKQLKILYLTSYLPYDIEALDLLSVQNLDGDLVFGQLVFPDLHLAEGPHAEGCSQRVVTYLYNRLVATGCDNFLSHLSQE